MNQEPDFWERLEQLARECPLVIDRPAGSRHPRWADKVYPLDYGYLDGTTAADGDGIDAWRGSLAEKAQPPSAAVTGVVVTLDSRKRDAEIKVLLGCTPEEMQIILRFHNDGHQTGLLIERPREV